MNTRKLLQRTFSVALIALSLSGYSRIDAQPSVGDWHVPTGFGEFVFTVSCGGTCVTKIIYNMSSWSCGGFTISGTMSSERTPPWPITDNQFTIESSLSPGGGQTMTINGTFSATGNEASGTWSADMSGTICSGSWGPITIVSVEEVGGGIPERFAIAQNYPNPFNPSTTIEFSLPRSGHVTLKVYNTLGEEIATLVSENLSPGRYSVDWDASGFASGLYFYRFQAATLSGQAGDPSQGSGQGFVGVRRLLLLR